MLLWRQPSIQCACSLASPGILLASGLDATRRFLMARAKRKDFSVDQLNQMQRYLGEEMIEDYHEGELTRRQMLRRLLGICGSAAGAAALMVACGEPTST